MILIFGTSKFGKTDRLPGLFHVVTEFAHLYYVPLIPLGSTLVMEGTNDQFGLKIGASGKSVFLGYLRTASFAAGLILGIWTLVIVSKWFGPAANDQSFSWEIPVLMVVAWALFALSYFWNKPSPERALMLARKIGIPMDQIVEHYVNDPRIERLMEKRQQEAVETSKP
jgi:hypothetical protein